VRTIVSVLVAGALAVSACGLRGENASESPGTRPLTMEPTRSHGETPVSSTTPPPTDRLGRLVDDAVADLSTRLEAAPATIQVIRAERVTWPDGSLGCPRPGETYPEGAVDGYQVVLAYTARVYLYHAGSDGPIFLCPSDDKDGGHEFTPPPGFHE
jgi:hypothetical protein